MFSVSLYIFLFVYFAFLAIFAIFAIINITHMFHTGSLTLVSFIVTLFTAIGTILIFYATWYLLQNADWTQAVTVWDNQWLTNIFTFN